MRCNVPLDDKDIEQIKGLIGESNKPLTDLLNAQKSQQEELAKNVGILADTLKNAPPAKAEDKPGKVDKPEPLTADGVSKIVAEAIAADRKQQAEQREQADAIKSAKDKVIREKLGNDADLGAFLPDTADAAQLAAAADKLAVKVTPKAKLPGTASDGGVPPARQPIDYGKLNASQKVDLGIQQLLSNTNV